MRILEFGKVDLVGRCYGCDDVRDLRDDSACLKLERESKVRDVVRSVLKGKV